MKGRCSADRWYGRPRRALGPPEVETRSPCFMGQIRSTGWTIRESPTARQGPPLRPCGGKVNAEFRLRFPRSEVADWAARYAYADDSEADHRRVGRKPGCYARDEFLAVTLWKIKRSRSRCANNSASTVREETEVALRASDERLRAGVLGSLAGSRCLPRGETQCGDAAAPRRAPPGPHHGPARIVAHGREPGRGRPSVVPPDPRTTVR